jgi:3-dehydroquinate synthase
MIRIEVESSQGRYAVAVGAGATDRISALAGEAGLQDPPVVVSTSRVWRLHGHRLSAQTGDLEPILIPDGERAKTLTTVGRLYDSLADRRVDRRGWILAMGGGVVGDVAGFAAATYLRGIRVAHVPTTLLAQVDSAIGGKTGVNLATGKNLAGAFHAPAFVCCDPDVLTTLSRRDFRSGLYEVVKYGVIASPDLFTRVEAAGGRLSPRATDRLAEVIAACCRIKAEIVGADEREGGRRRVLNFGHTVGHALEAVTHYRRFRHGEAVAYGMLAAVRLSTSRRLMPPADEARVDALIRRLGPLPPVTDLRMPDILEAMRHDKKIVKGTLHFVLTEGLGRPRQVTDITPEEMVDALAAIGTPRDDA